MLLCSVAHPVPSSGVQAKSVSQNPPRKEGKRDHIYVL